MKKLKEAGKEEALETREATKAAALELGYTEAEIESVFENAGRIPLDEDALSEAVGGVQWTPSWLSDGYAKGYRTKEDWDDMF